MVYSNRFDLVMMCNMWVVIKNKRTITLRSIISAQDGNWKLEIGNWELQ